MAYEQRDNSGVLWKNDRREQDTQPNARGEAMIDGVKYYVSAWTKQGAKGPFQSLAFKRVDAKPYNEPRAEQPAKQDGKPSRQSNSVQDMADDIPF